jgi:hypothetical protein
VLDEPPHPARMAVRLAMAIDVVIYFSRFMSLMFFQVVGVER